MGLLEGNSKYDLCYSHSGPFVAQDRSGSELVRRCSKGDISREERWKFYNYLETGILAESVACKVVFAQETNSFYLKRWR